MPLPVYAGISTRRWCYFWEQSLESWPGPARTGGGISHPVRPLDVAAEQAKEGSQEQERLDISGFIFYQYIIVSPPLVPLFK